MEINMLTEEQRVRAREADKRYRERHPEKAKQKDRYRYLNNRESEIERNAKYHRDNREKVAQRNRNRRHGITQEWFEAKVASQDNRCAVCRRVFELTPHIDHNHACCPLLRSCDKCRRDLLCSACNVMIGMSLESEETLQSAIQYVRKHKGQYQ
jgi:hypothetical protein